MLHGYNAHRALCFCVLGGGGGFRLFVSALPTHWTRTGLCCGHVCKAMGAVMGRNSEGTGMAFVEPPSVPNLWGLRLGPPLRLGPTPNSMGIWAVFLLTC